MRFILSLFLLLFTVNAHSEIPELEFTPYRDYRLEQYVQSWIVENYPKATTPALAAVIAKEILAHSQRLEIDVDYIIAVIAVESGFRPHARSVSNARGLMQVVPRWHREKIRNRDLFDPRVAIDVGTSVLREYLDKANGNPLKALKYYCGYPPQSAHKYTQSVLKKQKQFKNYIVEAMLQDSLDIKLAFADG